VIGAGLYLAVLAVLTDTGNPNLFPTMILLGALVVPLTFVTFADGRSGRWLIDGPTLGGCLLFGGVSAWSSRVCSSTRRCSDWAPADGRGRADRGGRPS
jgi:hypothetical protein